MEACYATGNLRALDLVEVNTNMGNFQDAQKTLDAARHLLLSALGFDRGGMPKLPEETRADEDILPKNL